MIKVTVGNQYFDRKYVVVNEQETTLRETFMAAGIEYNGFIPYINITPISTKQLDRTFAEMGVTTDCFLLCLQKIDNIDC